MQTSQDTVALILMGSIAFSTLNIYSIVCSQIIANRCLVPLHVISVTGCRGKSLYVAELNGCFGAPFFWPFLWRLNFPKFISLLFMSPLNLCLNCF